jgi:hypothetical protein
MNHSSGRFTAVDSPSTGCNGARAHVPVRLRRSSCHVARSGVLWSQSGPLRRCVDATDDREIGARCGFGQAQGGISRRAPSQRRRDKPVITRESPGAKQVRNGPDGRWIPSNSGATTRSVPACFEGRYRLHSRQADAVRARVVGLGGAQSGPAPRANLINSAGRVSASQV